MNHDSEMDDNKQDAVQETNHRNAFFGKYVYEFLSILFGLALSIGIVGTLYKNSEHRIEELQHLTDSLAAKISVLPLYQMQLDSLQGVIRSMQEDTTGKQNKKK